MSLLDLRNQAHRTWQQSRAYYTTPFFVFWKEYKELHLQECIQ